MPYEIRKGGECGADGYGVYKVDSNELVACHDSGSKAQAQFRLLEMLAHDEKKSTKHGDHDQSEHGNWAHGGGESQSSHPVVRLGEPYPMGSAHPSTGYREPLSNVSLPNGQNVNISSGGDAVPGGYNGFFVMHDQQTQSRMGYLDYQSSGSGADKQVRIAMVETEKPYQNQGVATTLLARLVAEFPDAKIEPGLTTEEGTRWWNSVQKLLPQSSKSLKHGDHDQSDHGNWATEGAAKEHAARIEKYSQEFVSSGGRIDPPFKAEGGESVKKIAGWDQLENKYNDAAQEYDRLANDSSIADDDPALLEAKLRERGIDLTTKAMESGALYDCIVARASDGSIAGALSYYIPGSENMLTVQMLGSTHEVAGTGTALMRQAMQIALDKNIPFQVLDPVKSAQGWYESLGLGKLTATEASEFYESKPMYRVEPERLAQLLSKPPINPVKHGDHDQSDHGNWAHGTALDKYVSETKLKQWEKSAFDKIMGHAVFRQLATPAVLSEKNLTTGQALAAMQYARNGYVSLNTALRGQETDYTREEFKDMATQMTMIDRAIAANELDQDTTLYRGMAFESGSPQSIKDLEVGGVYTDPAFGSTTTDRPTAMAFANGFISGGIGDIVHWEIDAPAGTSALSMSGLAQNEEGEVLLPRNTHYRIDSITTKPSNNPSVDSITVIKATVLPTTTKSFKNGDHDQSEHGNWAHPNGQDRNAMLDRHYEKEHPDTQWFDRTHSHLSSHPLTVAQEEAVLAYVEAAGVHRRINDLFAKYGPDPLKWEENAKAQSNTLLNSYELAHAKTAAQIMSAFESSPGLPSDTILYRGVANAEPMEVGQQYQSSGFVSTSTDLATAGAFGGGGTIFQITAPQGTKALDLYDTGLNEGEREVMLNRGTSFTVTKVETVPSVPVDQDIDNVMGVPDKPTTIVHVTIVPAATKSLKNGDHDQSEHGNWAHDGGVAPSDSKTNFNVKPTEDQFNSVFRYTRSNSGRINGMLRDGYSPEDIGDSVKHLDELISQHTLKEDTVVYRGGKWSTDSFSTAIAVGDRLYDEAYLSTSTSGGYARSFITNAGVAGRELGGPEENNIMMEIHVPAGSHALDVDAAMGSYGQKNGLSENEILLPRDTVLEVTGVQEDMPLYPNDPDQKATFTKVIANVVPKTTTSKSLKHGDHDQLDHGNRYGGGDSPLTASNEFRAPSADDVARAREGNHNTATTIPPYSVDRSLRREDTLGEYTSSKTEDDETLHQALNDRLRAGDSLESATKYAYGGFGSDEAAEAYGRWAELDQDIRRSVMLEDTTLFRASSPIIPVEDLQAAVNGGSLNLYGMDITPGAIVSDAGYLSTSKVNGGGLDYFKQNWGDLEGLDESMAPASVTWKITAPAGSPGLDLDAVGFKSQFGENEVILPRNTHMEITNVNVQTLGGGADITGSIVIEATVIPTHVKSTKHLPGDHDQEDHGNWATGGAPTWKDGKWTRLSEGDATRRNADLISKIAARGKLSAHQLRKNFEQWNHNPYNKVGGIVANGNVVIQIPGAKLGENFDQDKWTKLIEDQVKLLPDKYIGNRQFPIEVGFKNIDAKEYARTGVSYTGSDNLAATGGVFVTFKPSLMGEFGNQIVQDTGWFSTSGQSNIVATAAHEFGHVFSYAMAADEQIEPSIRVSNLFRQYKQENGGVDPGFISGYAEDSPSERYAEHYAAFQFGATDPLTLWLAEQEGWKKP